MIVDTLTFTLPYPQIALRQTSPNNTHAKQSFLHYLPASMQSMQAWRQRKNGMNGYKQSFEHISTGLVIACTFGDERMRVFYHMSGDTLKTIRTALHISPSEFMEHIRPHSPNVTRIDIAIDYFNSYSVENFLHWESELSVKGYRNRPKFYSSIEGKQIRWETMYLGSPSSDRRMRIYDKKTEQREKYNMEVPYETWTRCELQLRGDFSQFAYDAIVDGNNNAVLGMFRSFANFPPFDDYQYVEPPETESKRGNTVEWLLNVCAPALAKQAQTDDNIIADFNAIVESELFILEQKRKLSEYRNDML